MADEVKHLSDAGKLMSEFKTLFSVLKTRRTMVFAYGFMFAFVVFTVFLAFNPSGNSSPWFNNIFSSSSSESSSRSQFSSIFSYLFPNSSQPVYTPPSLLHNITRSPKTTFQAPDSEKSSKTKNQTEIITGSIPKSTTNHSEINSVKSPVRNQTVSTTSSRFSGSVSKETSVKNGTEKGVADSKNLTASFSKQINGTTGSSSSTKRSKEAIDLNSLMHCNFFDGKWVKDDSYPLYPPGSCSLIDESFNCFLNSRPDGDFQKHRWQPKGCNIPRLNGKDMLDLLRGKRLVFVGDSLNRNMWESLVCILRNSVSDKSQVFEASGRREFRTEGSYSFVFKEYNCSILFVRSPFLVQEWEMPDSNGTKKETLRLDIIERSSDRYKNADIIVFNTGHWWTHEKTSKGKDYYQEGSHVYGELSVVEAFRKALTTWARWVDANINSKKTIVFFRGYSASHFRGGRWNSGGQCDNETDPIKNETYLAPYPPKMRALESVLKGMKTPVIYLNITRMTDYRKDGHPSIYRKKHLSVEERKSPLRYQDCSHWCLPGVPDSWNELLFAELLIKQNQMKLQQQTQQQQKTP